MKGYFLIRDLDFISQKYCTYQLPKEKSYLLKYFKTPIQQAFLKYFFVFGDYENFVDHTGYYCQVRWLRLLEQKMVKLGELRDKAKADLDLELLAKIESGKLKLSRGFL